MTLFHLKKYQDSFSALIGLKIVREFSVNGSHVFNSEFFSCSSTGNERFLNFCYSGKFACETMTAVIDETCIYSRAVKCIQNPLHKASAIYMGYWPSVRSR